MRQCLIRKKYLVPKRRLSRFTSEKQHHFPGEQQFNDDIVMGTRNFEKPLSPIEFLPGSYMNIDYWLFSSFSDLFFFFIRFSRSCSFVGRRAVGHGLPPRPLEMPTTISFQQVLLLHTFAYKWERKYKHFSRGGNNKKTVQQGQLTAWNFHILGKKKEIWYASHHRGLDAFDIH